MLSRAKRIVDPAAGAVFANSKLRRLVMLFATEPLSLTEASIRSNIELKRLHHHVQRLVRLGLLRVCAERQRAGRPIKLYRATSDAFFIEDEAMPRPFCDQLAQELRASLQREAVRSSRGILFTLGPNGEPYGCVIASGAKSPDAFEMWRILKLDADRVRSLKQDLEAVLQRYQRLPARGNVVLVHAGLAPRADGSGAVDHPAS